MKFDIVAIPSFYIRDGPIRFGFVRIKNKILYDDITEI